MRIPSYIYIDTERAYIYTIYNILYICETNVSTYIIHMSCNKYIYKPISMYIYTSYIYNAYIYVYIYISP